MKAYIRRVSQVHIWHMDNFNCNLLNVWSYESNYDLAMYGLSSLHFKIMWPCCSFHQSRKAQQVGMVLTSAEYAKMEPRCRESPMITIPVRKSVEQGASGPAAFVTVLIQVRSSLSKSRSDSSVKHELLILSLRFVCDSMPFMIGCFCCPILQVSCLEFDIMA